MFALEQFLIHTWASSLCKLADIIVELQLPAAEEWHDCGIHDCEVVPDSELGGGREQLLDLSERCDEGIW